MKNFKCEDVINKIQWNQLRIVIRDDLPENALAGAFGDTIVLSKKLIQMVKNGLISKLSFLFIFLHEIAHIAQQAVAAQKMKKDELNAYLEKERDDLERNANSVAKQLLLNECWKSIVVASKCPGLRDLINLSCYRNVLCQYWMIDGKSSVIALGEFNWTSEIEDRLDLLKKIDKEIDKEKEADSKSYPELAKIDCSKANEWVKLQASAKVLGIHETFTVDAFCELFENLPYDDVRTCTQTELQNLKMDLSSAATPFVNSIKILRDDKCTRKIFMGYDYNGNEMWKDFNTKSIKIQDESIGKKRELDLLSLKMGASFNDRFFFDNLGVPIAMKLDDFLHASHEGPMQFLHSMDCSDSDKNTNKEKILRWVEFCVDVFNNVSVLTIGGEKNIKDISIREYVESKPNDKILKVMFNDLIKRDSSYKNYTINKFFGGELGYHVESMVIGSVAHMIQDSFALSHTKRSLDPFLLRPNDKSMKIDENCKTDNIVRVYDIIEDEVYDVFDHVYEGEKKTFEDQEKFRNYLIDKAMPIILFANYNEQNSDKIGGKHSHADIFVRQLNADDDNFENFYKMTLNAPMARDCTEAVLYMAVSGYNREDIRNFVDKLYPLTEVNLKTTKSGFQYYKKPEIESKYRGLSPAWETYGKDLEKLMCYNVKESLSSRINVYSHLIRSMKNLLESAIYDLPNPIEKKESASGMTFIEFVKYIALHFSEIVIDISEIVKQMQKKQRENVQYKQSICNDSVLLLELLLDKMSRLLELELFRQENNSAYYLRDYVNGGREHIKKIKESLRCVALNRSIEKYDYVLHIYTSDDFFAGTDGMVSIFIEGTMRTHSWEKISDFKEKKKRGSRYDYTITENALLGDLVKIQIKQSSNDDWKLDKIVIEEKKSRKNWVFFSECLVKQNDVITLIYDRSYFRVNIHTNKLSGSGTDFDVYIKIIGTNADGTISRETPEQLLDQDWRDDFEEGHNDEFYVKSDVGVSIITSIQIRTDGSDWFSNNLWTIDEIEIKDCIRDKYYFFKGCKIGKEQTVEFKPHKISLQS